MITDIRQASMLIKQNKVVAFPTETFYGIGGDANDLQVLERIFAAKKRAHTLPLPVIVASIDSVFSLVEGSIHPLAMELMTSFWPGPLSILLPVAQHVHPILSGNTGFIAIRQSPHPVAQALAENCKKGLVASSANISGGRPVCTAADIDPSLTEHIDAIIDIPPAPSGGKPSTLVSIDLDNKNHIQIHRDGAISIESLVRKGFKINTL